MKALVTGANGHLGFNVCTALQAKGHHVRASIRSRDDRAKLAPLQEAGIAEIVVLNVRTFDPFVEACRGMDVLVHVAATYALHLNGDAAADELLRDSTEGAANAVRAAAAAGVPKVVLTSSIATVPRVRPEDPVVTEADWVNDHAVPYFRAKVDGERAAWKAAEDTGVKLVTILPGTIGGPGFRRTTPSIEIIEGIMMGSMRFGAPRSNIPYVDVRDVADAHVLAAERDVDGRFLVVNDYLPSMRELSVMMNLIDNKVPAAPILLPDMVLSAAPAFDWVGSKLFGTSRLVSRDLVKTMRGKVSKVSTARAKSELGWSQKIPIDVSLRETMDAIRALRQR